jgi:hypothetical protein
MPGQYTPVCVRLCMCVYVSLCCVLVLCAYMSEEGLFKHVLAVHELHACFRVVLFVYIPMSKEGLLKHVLAMHELHAYVPVYVCDLACDRVRHQCMSLHHMLHMPLLYAAVYMCVCYVSTYATLCAVQKGMESEN